jgi:hypothetical protein
MVADSDPLEPEFRSDRRCAPPMELPKGLPTFAYKRHCRMPSPRATTTELQICIKRLKILLLPALWPFSHFVPGCYRVTPGSRPLVFRGSLEYQPLLACFVESLRKVGAGCVDEGHDTIDVRSHSDGNPIYEITRCEDLQMRSRLPFQPKAPVAVGIPRARNKPSTTQRQSRHLAGHQTANIAYHHAVVSSVGGLHVGDRQTRICRPTQDELQARSNL